MPSTSVAEGASLDRLARPGGRFALLAIDQRETLRTLLARAGRPAADADLAAFKVAVARAVTPEASGMLIDRVYGLDAVQAAGAVSRGCGLIVAVDELIQPSGEPLQDSRLDGSALTDALPAAGAVAAKFLCLWRPGDDPGPRRAEVAAFIEGCRRVGVVSVLEGLLRMPPGQEDDVEAFDEALLAAAAEFAPLQPDLYKTHVPGLGRLTSQAMTATAERLSATIRRPWVVLSAGVPADRFPAGVEAACRGGASGFLAGQGVWGPSIGASDPAVDLTDAATGAVARFRRLAAIVDAEARPWRLAVPAA